MWDLDWICMSGINKETSWKCERVLPAHVFADMTNSLFFVSFCVSYLFIQPCRFLTLLTEYQISNLWSKQIFFHVNIRVGVFYFFWWLVMGLFKKLIVARNCNWSMIYSSHALQASTPSFEMQHHLYLYIFGKVKQSNESRVI